MAVISITITPSTQEILPDIPATVIITTNIPSIIFYTLDGRAPTMNAPVYTSPIMLPEITNITLSVFATNGVDSSAIIVQQYAADISKIITTINDRLPHSTVSDLGCPTSNNSLYPFGTNSPEPNVEYGNPGNAGTTVYNQSLPAVSQGFNADGYPAVFTNKDPSFYQFNQIYSTTTYDGEIFPGVGNLPATTTIIGSPYSTDYMPEQSSTSDKVFNPRALVIYQDTTTEDPTNPAIIMRANFTTQNPEIERDGNLFFNAALDQETTTGTFIRRAYNPRTNMMTNSYFDSAMNRWIFSSSPYQPTTRGLNNLSGMVYPRGSSKIFPWVFGQYHTLT